MKRLLALLLALCLMLPLCAQAAEKPCRLKFYAANYLGYMGYKAYVQLDVYSNGTTTSADTLELRNQHGRVLATRAYKPSSGQLTFTLELDESHLGGHDLSVWLGDTQVSVDTAYLAVTDKHQKAVQTVDTDQPYMSISFDCAYDETNTDALLALLDELNIKATFFMTGYFLRTYPEHAKKICDAGHEIGCHSMSHPHLLEIGMDLRFKEVRQNAQLVRDLLGVNPRLFRPPFGEFDVTVSAPARSEGMQVCMWSIDSHDWDWAYERQDVLRRITKNVGPGTIILFHLDGVYTLDVLTEAVTYYREELGLDLVPITELMAMGGMELPALPLEVQ